MTIRRISRTVAVAVILVIAASSVSMFVTMRRLSIHARQFDLLDEMTRDLFVLESAANEDRWAPGPRTMARWNQEYARLVDSFDRIASLPGGEPAELTRLRALCRDINAGFVGDPPTDGSAERHGRDHARTAELLRVAVSQAGDWYEHSEKQMRHRLQALRTVQAAVLLMLSGVFLAMVSLVERRVVGPATALRLSALRIAAGNLDTRVETVRNDEMGEVGSAFNSMAKALALHNDVLARSESRLREAQSLAHVGSFERNLDTGDGYWSDELYRLLGYEVGGIAHSHSFFLDHVHEDDRDRVARAVADAARREGDFEFEVRLERRDGAVRRMHAVGKASRTEAGRTIRGALVDVTERTLAEEALLKQQKVLEKMRVMLERTEHIASIGSWDWIAASDTVTWSTEMYRLFGLDPSEPPPPFAEHAGLYAPGDIDRLRAVVEQTLSDGTPYRLEMTIVRPDGERRRGIVSGYAVREPNGEVQELYGSLQDVTELRAAEQALRDRERQYRALVNNTLDQIWVVNMDLVYTYVSPSVESMMGYTAEEIIGTHVREHVDARTLEEIERLITGLVARGPDQKGIVVEVPLRRKDGSEIVVEVRGSVVFGDDGKPAYVQGSSRDITERRRMQVERERLLQAIQHVAEGVVIADRSGTIEYVNPEFERMTGYSSQEAVGRNPNILKSGAHGPEFYKDFWQTIRSGRTWQGRFQNKRKDGSTYIEDDTVSPVRDASGEIINYVAVKRDVTRELQMESQLRQSQKMEAIGQLAGGVAHDFNNMLGVILGYAQQARDRVRGDGELDRALEEIVRASERSMNLTRQLLGFARRQAVSPRVIDLNDAITETLQMLERMIGEDIDLVWRPGHDVPSVEIDPTQLEQILANLVVNARDAIEGVGSVVIETAEVDVDDAYCAAHVGFAPGVYSRLSVSDNGSGMDAEMLAHVFEPFFTTKDASKGTGLGLATTYGIVHQNEGFINVYSEPGVGTTMKIYLPAKSGRVVRNAPADRRKAPRGAETVLLVEDEAALLELSVTSLEGLGYKVLPADRPSRALEWVRTYTGGIDLLMTDVVMPEMNGYVLWERIRETHPDLDCLFVSGYPVDVARERGRLADGVNFLQKPFTLDALALKLREVLEATRKTDA